MSDRDSVGMASDKQWVSGELFLFVIPLKLPYTSTRLAIIDHQASPLSIIHRVF